VCGCVIIYDFEGLGMKQMSAMTPTSVKRLLDFVQFAIPIRIKEIHFVKQPFLFNMVWQIMKPFVKEKLKKRVRSCFMLDLKAVKMMKENFSFSLS
jgi:retinaldehyde-binding protein 1